MKKPLIVNQKSNIKSIAIGTILAISSSVAYANIAESIDAYVGIDGILNKTSLNKKCGGNTVSQKPNPGASFFGGFMLTKNFGIEIGHQLGKANKGKRTFNFNDQNAFIFNMPVQQQGTVFNYMHTDTSMKQSYTYLAATARTNVFSDRITLGLILGITNSILKASSKIESDIPARPQTTNVASLNFAKSKPLFIVKGLAEYRILEQVGLRATTTWRNASSLKDIVAKNKTQTIIKLKNSFDVGIGISYYL